MPLDRATSTRKEDEADVEATIRNFQTHGQAFPFGCPRNEPATSSATQRSELRVVVGLYCDDECARTCPILRPPPPESIPALVQIAWSLMWQDGRGAAGRQKRELCPPNWTDFKVWRYIAEFNGGIPGRSAPGDLRTLEKRCAINRRSAHRALAWLTEAGLIERDPEQEGRWIPVYLTPEQLAELERRTGATARIEQREQRIEQERAAQRAFLAHIAAEERETRGTVAFERLRSSETAHPDRPRALSGSG